VPTSKTLDNFVINKLESYEVYEYLSENNLINEDEIYLVEGEGRTVVNYTTTLKSSQWSSKTQTLTISGLSSTDNGMISVAQSATAAQYEAAALAGIYVSGQASNSITVKCIGTAPSVDIPVFVSVWSGYQTYTDADTTSY